MGGPGGTLGKLAVAASMALAASVAQAQLYGRVDLGFSSALDAGIKDKNFAADGFICADPSCNSGMELNNVGESSVLSAGLGWRFSRNFRADLTIGYRGGHALDDSDRFPSDFKADITSTSVMLGAYWDFLTGGAVPYFGVGIGWAQNKIDEIVNTGGALGTFAFRLPGGTWSGMAWSMMAGVGIPLGGSVALDLGYRFIDLGEIESDSGPITCPPFACTGSYSGLSGKLRAHELMIGLRF